MRKKIFTILLALAASVGMMNAKVTWNSSNVSDDFNVMGTFYSYSKEGVTLRGNAEMVDARWQGYGDDSRSGIGFNTNETGGFTFSNTLGKNFTKIEMTLTGPGDWDRANLGNGWSFYWEPIEDKPATVTWTGNASTVDLLKDASDFHGDYVKSIVFYFEGDSEAPDPTYTIALKAGTANADKVKLSATSAVEGATITVTPNEEYEIKAFKATYNTTEEAASTLDPGTGAYSFKMPAYAVTIEATIALKPVPEGDIFAGFTATAGSDGFGGEGSANLVDNKFISSDWTKWCTNDGHKSIPTGESESCWWIDFEASAALSLTGYILTTGNDTGSEHGRNPKNWLLKAKLNADDAWTTIATVTDDVTMKDKSFKDYKFFVDKSGSYQYFRFEVFANQGAGVMQLCELRLIGTVAPAPAPVSPVTAARFLYNYDCQRNPAYPKQGTPCTLRGFSNPYVGYNGIGSDAKNTPFGPWKLEFVANYTPSNDYGCQRVVSQAVNQYYSSLSNQEKEAKRLEVPIFRLWQYNIVAGEYQHASYGIVCAYADEGNAEDHGALFISSEGNGCFLAGKPHDAQISLSCENDLTTGMNNLITAASATDPAYDAYMPVILSIDAIGTVELTQHCKDFIEGSSSAYNALTDAQKGQVTNYQVLVDAKNQWAPLVAEAKPYADAVVDLINAIPNPIVYTQSCQNKIDAAQNAYDALTSGQKIFVSNYEILKNAPSDLMKAAPYVHILFKANNQEKKVENVTLPQVFTEAEMKTMLKELYGVEGDYDLYAYYYADDAVNISGGKWTINPFMGTVEVNGSFDKFDPETGDMDMIPISLEITLELPPYEPEPLANCELAWKGVPEGGVVGTIGHEEEIELPYVIGNLDFMLALDAGTATLRLGSTDESVLVVYGFNNFAVNGVGECDVYAVHDEDAVFAYDSVAFHVTVNPEPTPAGNVVIWNMSMDAVNGVVEQNETKEVFGGITLAVGAWRTFQMNGNVNALLFAFNSKAQEGFTFANTLGVNFKKIVLSGAADTFDGKESTGWVINEDKSTITWEGDAASVSIWETLDFIGPVIVNEVEFTLEGSDPEPTPTVWTALKVGDVIKLGDKIEVPAEGDGSLGINGNVLRNAWGPYTLIRANIVQENPWDDPVVTEAEDGAYYVFKAEHSDFYPLSNLGKGTGLVVTTTSDGLEVTAAGEYNEFTVAVHDNGGATAIDEIGQGQTCKSQKLIRDGQILIIRDGKTYTVTGQQVR